MYIAYYGIYLVVSFVLIVFLNVKSIRNITTKFVIVALLPGVAWLLPIMWPNAFIRNSGKEFSDYVFRQQQEHTIKRIGIYKQLEKKKELNVIPIEDALVVSQHHDRRQVMIDVLKQDAINYIEILQQAVSNEDTETSHYAVSAIMEVKRKLLLSLEELSVKYENDFSDKTITLAYVEVLRKFLKSGFLDVRTMRKYQFTYLSVIQRVLTLEEKEEWLYQEKIDMELLLELYGDAEQTGQQYLEHFPDSEQAFLSLLKVYFSTKSKVKLQSTLEQLKKAPVRLSNHAITMVRFWSEGA
ncbi:hypothetical protein [Paenibacillus endoradicis]|uniref:hypothetical protein n=1 Tax=Paenibacillus endoradicis TaxID=2972487 RepID=UPI0021594588|nr:hypothetical protein [Paenibacillus endoradicis]MCR8657590.1 hypothetical protein [Paenibacillus endoradicis]